jgi:hypothetical protein
MKYLKLFENFSDKLYSEIDVQEWISDLAKRKTFPINQNLANQIIDRLKSGWKKSNSKPTGGKSRADSFSLICDDNRYINITYSDDEWWYCQHYNSKIRMIDLRFTYYKCDDMDGFIQLLQDLEIIS